MVAPKLVSGLRREGRLGVRRERRHLILGLLLASTVSAFTVVPAAADTNLTVGGEAVVAHTNGDGVNMRDAGSSSGNVITSYADGTTLKVISGPQGAADGSQWYNVSHDSQSGWIVSDFLSRAAASSGQTVTIVGTNNDGLRLRDGASFDSNTLTVIPEGATASVVGAEQTGSDGTVWVNLSYQGQTGYSSRDFIRVDGSGTANAEAAATPAAVSSAGLAVGDNAEVVNTNGDGLNMRYDVGYNSGVEAVAPEGAVVSVTDGPKQDGSGNTWWGVDYKGMKGWMYGDFLTKTDKQPQQATANQAAATDTAAATTSAPSSSLGQQIANEAMNYLGYPYVWAGTTPSGFDCSGFVYYIVNKVTGGGFPRDMASQATSGSFVDANNLQPGDLVFQQNTYQWGLSHVGIYIGNGQFISAANESVGVTISNLWDSYWGPRYYTARRVGP
jgi:cell wall-associated NlpC family hydrolase